MNNIKENLFEENLEDLVEVTLLPKFTVKFSNDIVLDDLELSGDVFIYNSIIQRKDLLSGLDKVEIIADTTSYDSNIDKDMYNRTIYNACLSYFWIVDGKTWFAVREKTEEEKYREMVNDNMVSMTEAVLNVQFDVDMMSI